MDKAGCVQEGKAKGSGPLEGLGGQEYMFQEVEILPNSHSGEGRKTWEVKMGPGHGGPM